MSALAVSSGAEATHGVGTGTIPPLLGDAHGRYRVHLVGNSGTGKTTTGVALAALLGVPFIALDELFYDPGWVPRPNEVFRANLRAALDSNSRGWVVDGNYTQMGGGTAFEEATDIIWLDPPLYVYFPRVVLRTFLRFFRLAPPSSPGCHESPLQVFFTRNSIFWWCFWDHWSRREENGARMALVGIENGSDVARRRMRRFGGWGGDVKAWLVEVADMLRARKD